MRTILRHPDNAKHRVVNPSKYAGPEAVEEQLTTNLQQMGVA